jgi:two-component system sensor histidine kinase CpxA
MRSITAKILLWCLGTLVLSWAAFVAVSAVIARRAEKTIAKSAALEDGSVQLGNAIRAYESGGRVQLAKSLMGVRRVLYGRYHLIGPEGRDLLTGMDRSELLAGLSPGDSRQTPDRDVVFLAARNDRYSLVWLSDWETAYAGGLGLKDFVPYYLLILAAVAVLFWLLAWNIASPLRGLAETVDRFGSGDLSVRVNSRRKDDIGYLGRSFDRMAARLETLLTAERRLLQDISHELRSPLARLSFAAELARTADDRDAAAGRLKKEISRLTNLVGALIQVTRAEGDPSLHHPEEMELDALVHEVVEDCRSACEAAIVVDADRTVLIRGDRELLRRTIENVVQNAIRYTASGASVEVVLGTAGDAARLSVRDFGPGVPEDAVAKLFQPFFRVDDSRSDATGGVGLGLAIAWRAVNLHHGRLWAENARPGLRITMELPLASRLKA